MGDSAALASLPLHGGFVVTSTPGARQVSVARGHRDGRETFTVKATLTAAGDQTLHGVRISLQLPQGWTAWPSSGSAVFGVVRPGQAPSATFTVTPPSYAPSSDQVVHATADLGGSDTREAGVTVTVGG